MGEPAHHGLPIAVANNPHPEVKEMVEKEAYSSRLRWWFLLGLATDGCQGMQEGLRSLQDPDDFFLSSASIAEFPGCIQWQAANAAEVVSMNL